MSSHKHKCLRNAQASVIQYSEQAFLLIQGKISHSKDKRSPRDGSPKQFISKSKLAAHKQNHSHKSKHICKVKSVQQAYLQNSQNRFEERKGGFQYSFRQMPGVNCPSKCNYSKQLEEQNMFLRKQNKCLQEYIRVLEEKCLNGDKQNGQNGRILESSLENGPRITSVLYDQSKSQFRGNNWSNQYSYENYFGRGFGEKDQMQETKYTQ